MLPKELRLPSTEIVTVARRGKLFTSPLLHIRYVPSNEGPQFAISISTAVSKSAVVRNRIKRKLRVAIVELTKEGFFKPGKHLFTVKSAELVDHELITSIKSTLR